MKASTFSVKPLPTERKFGKVMFLNIPIRTLTVIKKDEAKVIVVNFPKHSIKQKPKLYVQF
jgi:hypothetical protein